jgi:SAM-dependent methyltransferase
MLGEKGVIRLLRCLLCGLVMADRKVWRNFYAGDDYYNPDHQPEVTYPLAPSATELDRMKSIQCHLKTGRFLDYGGGLGKTGLAARQLGFAVTLIEDSERAVAQGQKYHPEIEWIRGQSIPAAIPDGGFDVASMFHVLEHIPEPRTILSQLHRVLKPNGLLVVEVPNWGSHMRRLQGLDWLYVMDHHVNYFDRRSLMRMVATEGFAFKAVEYRRTFAINESQPWKEHVKKVLSALGFGDVVRCVFVRK